MAIGLGLTKSFDLRRVQTDHGFTFALIDGIEELEQRLALRLSTKLGEDPYDSDFGLPREKLMSTVSPHFVRGAIKDTINADPAVLSSTAEIQERDDEERRRRVLRVDARARTELGIVNAGTEIV